MLRFILIQLVKLRLAWALVQFAYLVALDVIQQFLKRYQAFLVALTLVAVVGLPFCLTYLQLMETNAYQLKAPTLMKPSALGQSMLTYNQAEKLYSGYQIIYELQKNHRDILINLALLAQQLNKPAQAHEYWSAAQQTDPNNPLFAQN